MSELNSFDRGLVGRWCLAAVSGFVLVLALAGCSLKGGLIPDVLSTHNVVEPERPAFHFESGTLELGDFDYEDIKDDLFSPCEEISAEEFAAIGFKTIGQPQRNEERGIYGCSIQRHGSKRVYSVTGGSGTLADVRTTGRLIEEDASTVLPGVYVYGAEDPSDGWACFASVDTKRGQLGAAVGDLVSNTPQNDLCNESIEILEALYAN